MTPIYNGDERFRPLSPWAYWGLTLLYSVPVVGFIFLIIFSINGNNIVRRNHARSYWCSLIVFVAVIIITVAVFAATGALDTLAQYINDAAARIQQTIPAA